MLDPTSSNGCFRVKTRVRVGIRYFVVVGEVTGRGKGSPHNNSKTYLCVLVTGIASVVGT